MLVECIKITDEDTGEDRSHDSKWLRVGQLYTVLAIIGRRKHPYLYLLHSETQQCPIMVLPSDCRIISHNISRYWVIDYLIEGTIELMPTPWASETFWDLYNEGDPESIELYDRIRTLLEEEESSARSGGEK
jgi:hypothetical protein